MGERCAVIVSMGQTKYDAKRIDVSMPGLVREAALHTRARGRRPVGWSDIDAVVIGKAPDTFEGVMMPEICSWPTRWAAPASRCCACTPLAASAGRPRIVASSLVEAGIHERVLTLCFEKQSESNAMWALTVKHRPSR